MKQKYLPVFVLPALAILTLISLLYLPREVFSIADHIVISEVQIIGTGGSNEDFIELYNPRDTDYNLNGHRLVKRTNGSTSDSSIKSWVSDTFIPAHGFYLWANSGWTPTVTPDTTTSATLAADNSIALRQGPEDTGTIIDSVAWGEVTNAFVESSPFPTNPTADQSIERKPGASDPTGGNGTDTNNNAADFDLRTASEPQNTSSATEIPTPDTSPSPTPEPTVEPSATPEASPSPTPDISPSPNISPSPTPSASPEVNPSPSPTLTPSPSASAEVSPTPQPSPTPGANILFQGVLFTCRIYYLPLNTSWFHFRLPVIRCNLH